MPEPMPIKRERVSIRKAWYTLFVASVEKWMESGVKLGIEAGTGGANDRV